MGRSSDFGGDESRAWRGALAPCLTLRDIYGPGVYCPRASPSACRWLSDDPALLNARTGSPLTVAGEMAVVCSRGVAGDDNLNLLRDAGYRAPPPLHLFSDGSEHLERLAVLAREGARLVILHAHQPHEVPPQSSWVPRELLVFLNNKANLAQLVDARHAPRRRVVDVAAMAEARETLAAPVVIKAATDESTGGGGDVRLCRDNEGLARAFADFGDCARLVIEELLEIPRSLCLNYAVMPDGIVVHLGAAEQVCDEQGAYLGNWIDAEADASTAVVALGEAVAARGAALGYRGLVGVDVALLDDGRALAFDLNFRTNGSTASLLLRRSVEKETGASVMRLRSWKGTRDFCALLDAAYAGLDAGYFLPLASYDPGVDGFSSGAPRLSGLVLGASRDEVREHESELSSLGLI